MSLFPDTSFLCALYRTQFNSPQADHFVRKIRDPLPVSSLLLLEFRQSTRLQIRLHAADRKKGFGEKEGLQMLRDLQLDLNAGSLANVAVDWSDVHQHAEALSSKYTVAAGHRVMDILHVATALHLGAKEFLTFDVNQKSLATREGLAVPAWNAI